MCIWQRPRLAERGRRVAGGSNGTWCLTNVEAGEISRLIPQSFVENAYLVRQRLDGLLQVCDLCFEALHLALLLFALRLVIDAVSLALAGQLGFGAATFLLGALGGRVG